MSQDNPQGPPQSVEEYNARYHANHRVEGFGVDTAQVMPCPFCAAPEYATLKVLETPRNMEEERTCRECGRSGKALVTSDEAGMSFEFVQTGGDDVPDWYSPKIRRVDR